MRTIEVEENITLAFEYRENKDVLKDDAKNVLVKADLSKLAPADLMEWAASAMVVSFQSKLRSKNPPKAEEDGSYKWSVPSRGTRSTQDPAKVEEAAAKLVSKMDDGAKKHLVYTTLISMGKSEAEASVISGYTPAK